VNRSLSLLVGLAMGRLRISLLVAAVGLGALLLGFRSWYSRLNLAQVPPPPALNLGDAGQRHLENFRRFHKSIPQAEKEHILDGQFTVVRSTELLPARLKQAFVVIAGAQRFMMNDPDWKYPATIDQVFWFRRLVFAGLSENKWFIYYECSMSQHYYAVVVFQVDNKEVRFQWGGMAPAPATDLENLRKRIAAGQFADNLSWDW
jgi:hypothetical protein